MDEPVLLPGRDHALQSQSLTVDSVRVVITFPSGQQDKDTKVLDQIARILFDSYDSKTEKF